MDSNFTKEKLQNSVVAADGSSCYMQKFRLYETRLIKCYMQQLLSGLQHCHETGIMHRDIKASNLLIDRRGVLKIADFGLATSIEAERPLTNRVVPLWYRAPELLLGSTDYGFSIDLWSAGCLLAEMLVGRPIMAGRTEVEQIHMIFKLCGSPSDDYFKKLKLTTSYRPPNHYNISFEENFEKFPSTSQGLLATFLDLNPAHRGSVASALQSENSLIPSAVLFFDYMPSWTICRCPFSRKVREIVAILDLDVLFYPCPRNGPNFRQKVLEMGGKLQFPYMVDPNTGASMYESDDIIRYLVDKYGDGNVPLSLSLGFLTTLTAGLGMLSRISKGTTYTPAKFPPKPLKLWAYEGSPFCKIVREVLVELELPHLLVSCARGSPKRHILYQKTGTFQAPFLEDPNTGIEMFESAEIIEYLRATYVL